MSLPVPTDARSWFDAEDAPARADLRTCIHCGLCLTACPTYRTLKIEPDSPRGRLYLMRGLSEGRIAPSDPLVEHLENCLGCRACETVCPAGVPYGRLLEVTRGQLERRVVRGAAPRLAGSWALRALIPHRGRMGLAADLLRLGQSGPVAALVRGPLGRALPRLARRGLELTPPIPPRGGRTLEAVARSLPRGARLERVRGDLVLRPAGEPRARVAFFTNCVTEALFPSVHRASLRLLVIAGAEVTVPGRRTCCGALQAHAGLRRDARSLAARNLEAYGADGFDAVVTDSAGCGAALREYGHLLEKEPRAEALAARVRDVSETLAELGLPPAAAPLASPGDPSKPLRLAYHDACHLAHAQGVRSQPRALLDALPGIERVELARADWCCGSAGVYNLTHPEMADAQLAGKLDAIEEASPETVVASNPGCLLHLRRGAMGRGLAVRFEHLVEVLARAWPEGA